MRSLLRDSRLVTITGPGGTGKTRLAQEVARGEVAADGADVAFVPLEALSDADLIPVEILRALRMDIAAPHDPLERLVEALSARKTLLVLDNLEQLDGAGLAIKPLLDRVPELKILAASQAALHLGGEQEYALGTLPLPPPGPMTLAADSGVAASPAVRLFVERARAVRAEFALDESNIEAVVAICARLNGLPLAIELAAAQVKLLSPAAILARFAGRLDTLTSRRDDVPARQRTLRATVAWSYGLLAEDERRLFRRLAVFAGGAGLSEIEAIASTDPAVSEAFAALETLVDRSLVTVRRGRSGEDRYGLLETMRTYGRELLLAEGEEPPIVRTHAAIYKDLAHRAEPEFYGPERRAWLDRLSDEHDNLRAALDELESSGDLAGALDLAADLWRFWQQRGHLVEAGERLEHLLAAAAAPGAPEVPAIVRSRAEEAAGSIRYWTATERAVPRPFYERALEFAIASGDRRREAWARYNLAFVFDFTPAAGQAEPPDAARANELRSEALEIFRELGDRRGVAESLWAMGGNALAIARGAEQARAKLADAIQLLETIGDMYSLGWAYVSLGMLDAGSGNLDAAEQRIGRAADVFVRGGDAAGEVVAVQSLGALAALRGDDLTAVRLAAAAEAAARRIGMFLPRIPPIVLPIDAAKARVAAEDLRRESEIGVALGAESILATALGVWRARSGASEPP